MLCLENFFSEVCKCDGGVSISELPGLSVDFISKITDKKYQNAGEAIKAATVRAAAKLEAKIKLAASARGYKMKSIFETVEACQITDRRALPGGWRGFRVSKNNYRSSFTKFRISNLKIHIDNPGPVVVQIKDIAREVLYEIPVTVLAPGATMVPGVWEVDSPVVYVGFDQTGSTVYETDCKRGGGCCLSMRTGNNTRFIIDGWDETYPGLSATITNFGFGLTACIEGICEFSICPFIDRLKWPLLYLTGVEILREAKLSRRVTPELYFNSDNIGEYIDGWNIEADNYLAAELEGIYSELGADICWQCCDVPNYIISTS